MKRNGFTLIEVLAIIVLLALVALIATPIIIGVFTSSAKKAILIAGNSYKKAIETSMTSSSGSVKTSGNFVVKDGNLYEDGIKVLDVSADNKKVEDGSFVTISDGEVVSGYFMIDGYEMIYGGKEFIIGDYEGIFRKFEDGEEVYFDPTTGTMCGEEDAVSTTNTKNGCMKWYAFLNEDGEETVNLLLDHNTTATCAWNSSGVNDTMVEVLIQLEEDVKSWKSSVNGTARLIQANEVAEIAGLDTFDSTTSTLKRVFLATGTTSQSTTCQPGNTTECVYTWIYDRTATECSNYGCANNADDIMTGFGYWTSSKVANNTYRAWLVSWGGNLGRNQEKDPTNMGVRPVITISKVLLWKS